MIRDIIVDGNKIGELNLPDDTSEEVWQEKLNAYHPVVLITQKEKDFIKYKKRAEARDNLMAEMASENVERVRNGVWNVNDLIGLTQDAELKEVISDMSSLSYEIAMGKVMTLTNPIITTEIKLGWIAKLQANLY